MKEDAAAASDSGPNYRGASPFVAFSSQPEAVDRITRRLLRYAGLGELDLVIHFFGDGDGEAHNDATQCEGIAGCFFGIEGSRAELGINVDRASDPEQIAGVMASFSTPDEEAAAAGAAPSST